MAEKKMVTLFAPNKEFNGMRLGVVFKDGEAQCDKQTAKELKALYGYYTEKPSTKKDDK